MASVNRLTSASAFRDCRIAFTEWGLPGAIQTDRDTIYVDSGKSPFPNRIVLWRVGLGIEQRLIPRRTPKRNGTVERSHRTLQERTLENQEFASAAELQKRVDADWYELNHECPSRAKGCHGQPPLVAHPELLTIKRPYRPEGELARFDLKRVEAYLAEFTWTRSCTSAGQIRMRKERYSLELLGPTKRCPPPMIQYIANMCSPRSVRIPAKAKHSRSWIPFVERPRTYRLKISPEFQERCRSYRHAN